MKKHETVTDNPSIKIYAYRLENRIIFKVKAGSHLELLMPKTVKLLGSTKCKMNKDKNRKNVPHLEINKVILVHYNIVNNDYQQDSRVSYTFVPNKSFGQLQDISPKKSYF